MYQKIFIPLMMINNNVYTFVSGIFISLSTNIFTSLCFEKNDFYDKWFMYIATAVFLLASVLCMYLAAKLSRFQNYIIDKHITNYTGKVNIILEATKKEKNKWVIIYICFVILVIIGIGLIALNFVY